MFKIIDDRHIELTRGDMLPLTVSTLNEDKTQYEFKVGDTIRIKIYEKNKPENVVVEKTFEVTESSEAVDIDLTADETKIGDYIKKPVEYWYEIEVNPDTPYTNTIVGYDRTLGPAIFWLLPEGGDKNDKDEE